MGTARAHCRSRQARSVRRLLELAQARRRQTLIFGLFR